jgi:hypothetical protein
MDNDVIPSPLSARLSKAIGTIPHGFRLVEVGAMAMMLVVAGFETNLIIDILSKEDHNSRQKTVVVIRK